MAPYIQLTLAMFVTVSGIHGYHILCYHPVPSPSHDLLARGIIDPLLKAGHKITWVTPYPVGKPDNVTVIDVSRTVTIVRNVADRKVTGFERAKQFADDITRAAFTAVLQRALVENEYDAVVSEWFFSDVEAGFAAVQQVPWILLSGFPMHPHLEGLVDTVKNIPTNPSLGYTYPLPMNFWSRVKTVFSHLMRLYDDWINYINEEVVYESFFKPVADARKVPLPRFSDAMRDVAVLLVNAHPSFVPAASQPPNVVHVGGYHIAEHTPPLPQDLQEILNSSSEGVVYFSMGTLMRSAGLPEQVRRDLIEVLASVPYTVLWKYEEELSNLPKNIHVRAWMPQSSILAHPNVKVFVSHCGLLSNMETLHYGVPMLALPVFGDQHGNADRAAWSGYAVKVPFGPDMKEEFRQGLKEILSNDSYYQRVKYVSRLFRHRPTAPPTLIKDYIELAIESKGAHHLRSTAALYEWHQLWMVDQAAALLLASTVTYYALKALSSFMKNKLEPRKAHEE